MRPRSAPAWHVVARHKIAALFVAVAAGAALTVALVLTLGSDPAAGQSGRGPTVHNTVAPAYHFDCDTQRVVSFC
jgi:hypothetical protein